MRILITGAQGQVGWEAAQLLPALGEVLALDRAGLDLADANAIRRVLRDFRPQVIVNAGAYTAVDRAQTEFELARAINALAPGVLAEEAKRLGALLIHYSTDYVFDGEKREPYRETDPVRPLNAYGQSKLEGEQAILASGASALILRTSWVYATRGKNFLLTMQRLGREREELGVVADQTGVPNWAWRLAAATRELLRLGPPRLAAAPGIYHLTAGGSASWYDFAKAIFAGTDKPRLRPISTAEYPLPATRPAYGVLSGAKLEDEFGLRLPHWREDLSACLATQAG
ncbi:dTDP-4-dehydrorhamnose reductase [Burkholderiales bacterium]|nr:MAG: dTDP-4-dehydrorhamnose reductase [Burkholderiales bacterium]CAG0996562.1 dTDP-4-dehydrorhamnose reductase [Burkholderiales bacterium]